MGAVAASLAGDLLVSPGGAGGEGHPRLAGGLALAATVCAREGAVGEGRGALWVRFSGPERHFGSDIGAFWADFELILSW
jgi:hypothetical protein